MNRYLVKYEHDRVCLRGQDVNLKKKEGEWLKDLYEYVKENPILKMKEEESEYE